MCRQRRHFSTICKKSRLNCQPMLRTGHSKSDGSSNISLPLRRHRQLLPAALALLVSPRLAENQALAHPVVELPAVVRLLAEVLPQQALHLRLANTIRTTRTNYWLCTCI